MIRRSDDPAWEAAFHRFWTVTLNCEWCWQDFRWTATPSGGNKPHYCGDECRRKARRSAYLYNEHGRRENTA